ncbi:hypothetical protein GCM10009066_18040 [Halarchaeum salinum]|uniref:Uncharacterized protein n=1 Tax=Halarchaeum salinum TaxID=489912 RepID=A0AAV3S8Z2_9EURY
MKIRSPVPSSGGRRYEITGAASRDLLWLFGCEAEVAIGVNRELIVKRGDVDDGVSSRLGDVVDLWWVTVAFRELRHDAGSSRHRHLLMLAYHLLKFGAAHSAL